MIRRALLVAVVLAVAPALEAQVNVERLRVADTATGWFGEASLTLSVRTGNVRHTRFDPATRVDLVTGGVQSFLVARGDVGIQGGRRYSNSGLMHLRATGRFGRFAPEAFAQVNYDRSQLLLFRGLAGAGVRLRLATTARGRVRLGTALMYEVEHLELDSAALHPSETRKVRWSSYLSARTASARGAVVAMTAYAQPDLADFADTRLLADATLAAPLTGGVALTLTLWSRLDTRPPDGVKRLDTEIKSGVAVAF